VPLVPEAPPRALPRAQQELSLDDARLAPISSPTLRDQFLIPPFSVLGVGAFSPDRDVSIRDLHIMRRRQWEALGIEPETFIGREDNLLNFPANMRDGSFYEKKQAVEAVIGCAMTTREFLDSGLYEASERAGSIERSVSIFDPVVAEACYRWWCPPGGLVYDPFAGGACRGIVAAALDRPYIGVELRPEQVEANKRQAQNIFRPRGTFGAWATAPPLWLEGDARRPPEGAPRLAREEARATSQPPPADFILSCPPYHDLERYSDRDADLSTMDWPEFRRGYQDAIADATSRLREDRFAAFVVGELRGPPPGFYKGFVQETIATFDECRLSFYNDIILATSVGTAPRRVGRYLKGSGKIARVHQNLLVFVKGDPMAAAALCEPMQGLE